jgi:predicted enzyme related to lactoylglutathione lyase
MQVRRIVTNIEGTDSKAAKDFYQNLFGLDVLMDHGWIQTFGSERTMTVQLTVASEGGSGTPVPDLSIEVDDLSAALNNAKEAGVRIQYGPTSEPWGVRRFYIRDPFGKLLNILQHE